MVYHKDECVELTFHKMSAFFESPTYLTYYGPCWAQRMSNILCFQDIAQCPFPFRLMYDGSVCVCLVPKHMIIQNVNKIYFPLRVCRYIITYNYQYHAYSGIEYLDPGDYSSGVYYEDIDPITNVMFKTPEQ